MLTLDKGKEALFEEYSEEILSHEDYEKLKGFMAHGKITLYTHCVNVARLSLKMSRNRSIDEKALVRGALLHDFYLYDWHDARIDEPLFKMHGFTHPFAACERAKERFKLSEEEQNIIESHMWPLTLFTFPRSREAWIVCMADKIVATGETFKR